MENIEVSWQLGILVDVNTSSMCLIRPLQFICITASEKYKGTIAI
jgi:hypothetical protein